MIDWLTLKVPGDQLPAAVRAVFLDRQGCIVKLDPSGAVEWETPARESIRSDSHQVSVVLGGDLSVSGSPARVMVSDNVFGSGDPQECARAMLAWVSAQVGVELPALDLWRCTRMDVTHSYDLRELSRVRVALMSLRHAEGGRYQLRTASESVYWSTGSALRSGKAYAKGPHMRYLVRKGTVSLSEADLCRADRLLRLELSLRSQWWRERSEKKWWEYTESELDVVHAEYFVPLIGEVKVTHMSDEKTMIEAAGKRLGRSDGQVRAAVGFWALIQSHGHSAAREMCAKTTYYRHMQILREAGLSWADIQARRVVPLRREPLVLSQPVRSWDELRRVA